MKKRIRNFLRIGKKGTADDLVLIVVVLFVFALVLVVVFKVSDSLNTEFQANDKLTDKGKGAYENINNLYSGVLDNSFMLLTIGMSLMAIALAAMVRIHPIFIAFFIFVWLIVIFLSATFSNIYQTIAADSSMVGVANQLTFTSQIMGSLPWIVAVVGALLAIVMYKAYRGGAEF